MGLKNVGTEGFGVASDGRNGREVTCESVLFVKRGKGSRLVCRFRSRLAIFPEAETCI